MAGPWGSEPEIVVVALAEFGTGGSATAAPIAAKAADFFLRKRHGIPFDSVQTLREHLTAGRPAPWAGRVGSPLLSPTDGDPVDAPDPDGIAMRSTSGGGDGQVLVLPPPPGR